MNNFFLILLTIFTTCYSAPIYVFTNENILAVNNQTDIDIKKDCQNIRLFIAGFIGVIIILLIQLFVYIGIRLYKKYIVYLTNKKINNLYEHIHKSIRLSPLTISDFDESENFVYNIVSDDDI